MKTKRIDLATMQNRLTREQMKAISGGDETLGGLCPGILSCRKDDEGNACPDINTSIGCTCRKDGPNDYVCMP